MSEVASNHENSYHQSSNGGLTEAQDAPPFARKHVGGGKVCFYGLPWSCPPSARGNSAVQLLFCVSMLRTGVLPNFLFIYNFKKLVVKTTFWSRAKKIKFAAINVYNGREGVPLQDINNHIN